MLLSVYAEDHGLHIVPLTLALNARLAKYTPVREESDPQGAKGNGVPFFHIL